MYSFFFFLQVVFNNSTGRTGDTGGDAGRTRGRTDTRTHGRTDTALRTHHHGAAARGDERGEATYTTEGTEGSILEGECAASAARVFPACVIGFVMRGRGLSSASQRVRPRFAAPHRPPRAGALFPRRTSADARPLCLRSPPHLERLLCTCWPNCSIRMCSACHVSHGIAAARPSLPCHGHCE